MAWSKVKTKFRKPIGWWYHKIMCELKYHLEGSGKEYYYHLNKMCDNYKINLYGERMQYYAQRFGYDQSFEE